MLCSFFFNDTATTEIYTLSLHDALPISRVPANLDGALRVAEEVRVVSLFPDEHEMRRCHELGDEARSEEHTSELQSQFHLVCRLLLEKKKTNKRKQNSTSYSNLNQYNKI